MNDQGILKLAVIAMALAALVGLAVAARDHKRAKAPEESR
jgi:hypothetical protein